MNLLEILVGVFTLGLPVWFAFLDRHTFPGLRWVQGDEPPPLWGRMVVVVGVALGVLIALAAPFAGFETAH